MNPCTLSPEWEPEACESPSEQWQRQSRLGLECFSYTAKGTDRHPNEDGFVTSLNESLVIGVLDETTQKRGLESGVVLQLAAKGIRQSFGTPVERLAAAHRQIRRRIDAVGKNARAGVSALVVDIGDQGRFRWAAVGDCSLVVWQAQRWWRRGRIQRLNRLQHQENGQLTQALGMPVLPEVQFGEGQLQIGDLLLAGSDGVFHGRFDFSRAFDWVAANRQRTDATLRELAMKLLHETRLDQEYPDDQCLVMVLRQQ